MPGKRNMSTETVQCVSDDWRSLRFDYYQIRRMKISTYLIIRMHNSIPKILPTWPSTWYLNHFKFIPLVSCPILVTLETWKLSPDTQNERSDVNSSAHMCNYTFVFFYLPLHSIHSRWRSNEAADVREP